MEQSFRVMCPTALHKNCVQFIILTYVSLYLEAGLSSLVWMEGFYRESLSLISMEGKTYFKMPFKMWKQNPRGSCLLSSYPLCISSG